MGRKKQPRKKRLFKSRHKSVKNPSALVSPDTVVLSLPLISPKILIIKAISLSWPFIAIIVAHSVWGVNFIVAKLTLQEVPPMTLAFLRFTIASLLLLPFILFEKKKNNIAKEDIPWLILVGVTMVSLNISFFYLGLMRTTAIEASTLTLSIPVLSVLLGWLFLKEKIYVANVIGILLGLVGASLVIGLPLNIIGLNSSFSDRLFGNLLILFSSICWVIAAVLSKKLSTKYTPLTITTVSFFVGVITFAVPALNEYMQNPSWVNKLSLIGLSGITYIAVASSVCAFFLFEWGVKKLGVVKADLFQYLEPLIAASLGVLILAEGLRFSYIAGAILIALGAYWGTYAKDNHKHHKAHRG